MADGTTADGKGVVGLPEPALIVAEEQARFERAGFDFAAGEARLNAVLEPLLGRRFDVAEDSIHWLLFACLEQKHRIRKVLEIGTYDAQFIHILARLHPEAQMVTVDLPESDPLLRVSYDRYTDEKYAAFRRTQAANLALDNIAFVEANSLFLPALLADRDFDVIWVDGASAVPEIVWDIANAYHFCADGGAVLVDDVILHPSQQSTLATIDAYRTIEYVAERTGIGHEYFLKRWGRGEPVRGKYVAYCPKPAGADRPAHLPVR